MKAANKSKIAFGIVFLMIASFIVWNIIWAINYSAYSKLSAGYEKYYKTMGKKIGLYNYTLKCPNYFSFHGNFAITNDNLSIIIWPDLFIRGGYTYGLKIFDRQLNHGYMFYVDSELNYLDIPENNFSDEEIKIIIEILNKNSDELKKMCVLAKNEWDI